MEPSSRDRISVDLRGLKAALFERAQALGMSPSALVRSTLAEALSHSQPLVANPPVPRQVQNTTGRVRLSLRMSHEHAAAAFANASRAGLNPGDYIGNLVAGVPVLTSGASRTDHIATLVASSAELSTLSRNIHHLTALLREGNVQPALVYRDMLDTLAGDVRRHLALAAGTLADLRPRSRSTAASAHRAP
jgi:hypothetical protein